MATAETGVSPGALAFVLANLRAADRAEIYDVFGETPAAAIARSVERSERCLTGYIGGHPAVLAGVARRAPLSGTGFPWLVATDAVDAAPLVVARAGRALMGWASSGFDRLENMVDPRNALAMRWVTWLGFTLGAPVMAARTVALPFWMEMADVR